MGSMGQESDWIPDLDFDGTSPATYLTRLEGYLASWSAPSTVARTVYNLYSAEMNVSVQKAVETFNADYGIACGTAAMARVAKAGAFSGNIYVFVNEWGPASQIDNPLTVPANHPYRRYAYHTWDYLSGLQQWAGVYTAASTEVNYAPAASDLQLSALLRRQWLDFAYPQSTAGWQPFRAGNENTFVYRSGAATSIANYKSLECGTLASSGFDQRFYWAN